MYREKPRPPPLIIPGINGDCSEKSVVRKFGGDPNKSDQCNGAAPNEIQYGDLPKPVAEGIQNVNLSQSAKQASVLCTQTNGGHKVSKELGSGKNASTWRQKIRPVKAHRMMSVDQLLRLSLNAEPLVDETNPEHPHKADQKHREGNYENRDTLPRHQALDEATKVSTSPENGKSREMGEFPDLVRDHRDRQNAKHARCDAETEKSFNRYDMAKAKDDKNVESEEEDEDSEKELLLPNKEKVFITKVGDKQKMDEETSRNTALNRESLRALPRTAAVEEQKVDETHSEPATIFCNDIPSETQSPIPSTSGEVSAENTVVSDTRVKKLPPKAISFPEPTKKDRKLSMVRRKTLGSIETRSCSGICLICCEWVGVHHSPHSAPPRRANSTDLPSPDNSLASPPCTPSLHSPSSPVTPHIVVSEEGDEDFPDGGGVENFGDAELNIDNNEDFSSRASNNKMCRSTEDLTGSRSDLSTKVQMTPDMGQSARHNSISSYLAPEVELSLQRKTRRNSMIGMIHRASSVNNLNLSPNQQQHLARVASAGNLRHGASRTSLSPSNGDWRREGNDSMIACLSALYGKILVVMGLAFPIGEFISGEMPLYIYKGFYLYLHLGSIAFLVYAYMFLLQVVPLPKVELKSRLQNFRASTADLGRRLSAMGVNLLQPYNADKSRSSGPRGDVERGVGGGGEDARSVNTLATFQNSKNYTITESTHESMYLKMGAMVFGIGSMIYSGLEVGQYFDLKSTAECADILLVISPVSRMLFTFIQMYFIFLNSRVAINKHRTIARFGLMHMIATNLCIWLNVLVEETKHEIHSLTHASSHGGEHHGPEDYDELYGHGLGNVIAKIADTALRNGTAMLATAAHGALAPSHDDEQGFIPEVTGHHIVRRATDYGAEHPTSMYDCRRSDMMSRLVDNASPFLFPCTIEYSLLCSGVLYVIWKNINKSESNCGGDRDSDISTFIARKARHHYSVDCAHATRGLFMGILVLVLTIISLILFFVLINNENTKSVAVLEANIIELSVYSVAILTVIIGMIQMRELEFVEDGDIELDNILLLIAQTGTYIYTSFTIIGGNFSLDSGRILPFFTAVITLIQTTLQTLFILNASRRCCYNYDQLTRKPGREMVTFLLICNLAMWAISTFETSRADAHPTQLNYYGVWAWTIISHVSMPLAIFYRFHVTVCLCEIWKRSYKLKNDFL